MDFNSVLNGVVRYVDNEMIAHMNAWQELLARVAMARVINNADSVKNLLTTNAFARTFAIADEQGNIDVDGLICDIKKAIAGKGHIEIDVPMFGKFKFVEQDVDKLRTYIRGV
jgi:hypothetical protein